MGILEAPAIFVLARKMGYPRAYLGLIPIVNIWVAVAIADSEVDYRSATGTAMMILILWLLPIFSIFGWIMWGRRWGDISDGSGQSPVLGWFVGVPLIGAIASWIIAARAPSIAASTKISV